ncbi:ROK family transcriptional regulator [Nocardiopsis algeriensis]|uniref:Putative NBD/HSP70 family sugar kinase n=1 Tax=Nocardiopsis algeriensis TaxID=1478215 RepID=A0A841IZZ4_9ACTN|nr:ROK family transcriptional regulator [Nocardiopsis algeriensis]MBB6121691.1 putative NBD/HSP70 family sugar kinase [Nocardiopsis algeriensis]
MSGSARAATHATSRGAILDVIRAAGTISRAGLVRATGFTAATISNVVRGLLRDGLVVETGRAESTGGKPRVLLRLNGDARYAVGVHLDPIRTSYVLTDLTGAVVSRLTRAGRAEPSVTAAEAADRIGVLVAGAGVDRDRVLGAGVVAPPGTALPGTGDLERALGLPVVLGRDAAAAALGEYWSGEAGRASVFATVYMGTGIGAGVLVNGIPYQGAGGAGEIGHVCLDPDGPVCWCGARGCAEAVAGPAAVVAAAREDAVLRGELSGPSVAAQFTSVVRAARAGRTGARVLLERSARHLAVAVRTLANLMDPELIVLTGSSLAVAAPVYLPAIEHELGRALSARGRRPVRVRMSTSASTAPAIGAAAMVLRSRLVPFHPPGLHLPDDISEAVPGS